MSPHSLRGALIWAIQFAAAAAQTIVTGDGTVLAANRSTIAPAGEMVASVQDDVSRIQLTDAVLANLTALQLTNVSLFGFGGKDARSPSTNVTAACKAFPGDADYPAPPAWTVLDLLTGGGLIKTVPIGAVCYPNQTAYDAVKCQDILANWTKSETHVRDPTSVMSPLFQGETCSPQKGNSSTSCTLGGFPSYAVKITTVAQAQLAVNFARNANLRLVVKNTGHDFLGKSMGAGALSIWTHHLKGIQFLSEVSTPSYSGPAFRIGAGVQVGELYAAANQHNVTAVGGECKGVGVAGGYTMGGGHSPMSTKYGLGADQVLSADVVLADGRFITVNETSHPDLFFALRGGGGATFGVVTALTVKVYPRMTFSGVTYAIASGANTNGSSSAFWSILYAYWRRMPEFAAKGSYGYSMVFSQRSTGALTWNMLPWLVPGMPLDEFKAMTAPLFAEWAALGLTNFTPTYFEYDNFYDAWTRHFPTEGVAVSTFRTASRLFPRALWNDTAKREALFDAVSGIVKEGSALIQYNINPAKPQGTPANGANSHWRDAVWFTIMGAGWTAGVSEQELETTNRKITEDWMGRLRGYGPGGYGNEGDVMEPDFGEAFFGSNYQRLLRIKQQVDPGDLFWAPTAVGSEKWKVQGPREWLAMQTGKLCRVH